MGKQHDLPRVLNQTSAVKLLESEGWSRTLGGKHNVKMEKEGKRPITLPQHRGRDYSKSLTSAILREAGLKGGDRSQ
jgi:predicted RNA binding protein YcfA (HicA-like mRNA interferase family)